MISHKSKFIFNLLLISSITLNILAKSPLRNARKNTVKQNLEINNDLDSKIEKAEKSVELKKQELSALERKLESLKKQKLKEEKGSLVFYDLGSGTGKVAWHACYYDVNNPQKAKDFIEREYKDIRGEIPDDERNLVTRAKGSPVYGEILLDSFEKILKDLNIPGFAKVVGVELAPTRYHHALSVQNRLKEAGQTLPCPIEFRNENIAETDISDANVIYMCSTCYPDELMDVLVKRFSELKDGLMVLTLKSLPSNYADFGFDLIKEFTLPMTWSEGSPVYVYKLKKDNVKKNRNKVVNLNSENNNSQEESATTDNAAIDTSNGNPAFE